VTGRKPAVDAPIPNRIAELREQAGLSRVELARRVGVNPQTIGYLERGEYNPSLVLAFRLADLFDLTIEQIFARENG
jgi:DNA-binding XRE family transcriptional regulator